MHFLYFPKLKPGANFEGHSPTPTMNLVESRCFRYDGLCPAGVHRREAQARIVGRFRAHPDLWAWGLRGTPR